MCIFLLFYMYCIFTTLAINFKGNEIAIEKLFFHEIVSFRIKDFIYNE